ncbi:MAG: MFS transporter, partial [Streptosporangiaceae bacterium]
PRERGRYMSYMMVVMMLATIGGPLLGGFITTAFSWRWIFYINIPVGGAALVYLLATLHVPAKKVSHKVDYLGGSLLAVAATALILLATWGGTQYPWGSARIIGLGLITAAATVAFCVTETRAAEPMLPLHVFRNRNFSVTMALTFLTGLAMFGALTFLPLYQQTVQGESPTVSGLALTPMMLGVTVTSIVAGQVTTKTGRYKVFPILGGAIMAVGMYLLTGLDVGTTRLTSAVYYVVLGLGMGFLMQMVSVIAQNSVQQKDMGVASSARMFFQQIGGSLGVAAFGAVFARRLTGSLAAAASRGGSGAHVSASGGQLDPATVDSLPAQVKHDVFFAIAHAVQGVFIWALPAAVLIFALAWFIKEVPLRARAPAGEAPSQQAELVS